jgi:hypothetical protein
VSDTADLRAHIDAAHAAADRLVREAEARARATIPDRGWDVESEHRSEHGAAGAPLELSTVVTLLGALKEAIPAELSAQLAEALRELLLAVRALIDWYLERLERPPRPAAARTDVEDIPIQ